jgi:hypothetical protein
MYIIVIKNMLLEDAAQRTCTPISNLGISPSLNLGNNAEVTYIHVSWGVTVQTRVEATIIIKTLGAGIYRSFSPTTNKILVLLLVSKMLHHILTFLLFSSFTQCSILCTIKSKQNAFIFILFYFTQFYLI